MTTPAQPGGTYVVQQQPSQSGRTAGGQGGSGSGTSRTGSPSSGGSSGGQQGGGKSGPNATVKENWESLLARFPRERTGILVNRNVIFYAWIAAMILVGFDEWHNYGILPRPARLWYTSLTYGLLAVVSVVDTVVPLANALAVGYTLVLLYQYYNKQGQFA